MRKFTMLLSLLGLLLVGVLPLTAFAQNTTNTVTILDVVQNNENFSSLATAVEVADMTNLFAAQGAFTFFAPTNAAFNQTLTAMGLTMDQLLADPVALKDILSYHVVPGVLSEQDIISRTDAEGHAFLPTLEGVPILVSVNADGLFLNESLLLEDQGTQVVTPNIGTTNGIVHVIDSVLLPTPEVTQPARVRFAQLTPDVAAVDVYLNGELSDIQTLTYPNVTGWIEMPPATYEITLVPQGGTLDDALIIPLNFAFDTGTWTTLTLVHSPTEGIFVLQRVREDLKPTLEEGMTRVTFFAAINDAAAVDVLANGEVLATNLTFANAPNDRFVFDIPAGTYDLQIVPTGQTEPIILDLPGTQLNANTFYFIAITGTMENASAVIQPIEMTGEEAELTMLQPIVRPAAS